MWPTKPIPEEAVLDNGDNTGNAFHLEEQLFNSKPYKCSCSRVKSLHSVNKASTKETILTIKLVKEGGVRVRGDAVLRCFWCGFSEIFFLTCGIAVFQGCAVCGNLSFRTR